MAFSIVLMAALVHAEGLTAERLGVVFNKNNPASERIAEYYVARRRVPAVNVVGLSIPDRAVISRGDLAGLRSTLLERLPASVQSLLLVWSRPNAVECMSVTSAIAAGSSRG